MTPTYAVTPVNQSLFGGVAIDGYDPVAYFTMGRPVQGRSEFSLDWNGASWRFANSEHREMFRANPERYAPQYGGYCAFAVAHGQTAGIDPNAWAIVDGKLYLNYDADIQRQWVANQAEFIRLANQKWPALLQE
ncbi:MAG: YHS domain protein [Spirochaetales bacterium]|nr:YHS domain protein [Spirochaetales bacterium]MCP5485035.1 YHS domain protein [Spirochaetales bacterium]